MQNLVKQFEENKQKFYDAEKFNVAMKLDYLIKQVHLLFDISVVINKELFADIDKAYTVEESTTVESPSITEKPVEIINKKEPITNTTEESENNIVILPHTAECPIEAPEAKYDSVVKVTTNVEDSDVEEIVIEEGDERSILDILTDKVLEEGIDPNLYGDDEDITIEDVMTEEFKAWGLDVNYVGCKFIFEMINIAEAYNLTRETPYDVIANVVSPEDPSLFKRSITFIRKKADFSKSEYLSILSKLPDDEITNIVLLLNILDLCY